MNWLIFIFTFVTISILPGINMTFAMYLGVVLGYKKSLITMFAMIISLGFICLVCVIAISSVIMHFSNFFMILKIVGGFYLIFLSFKMFKNSFKKKEHKMQNFSKQSLFSQGFLINLSNPKAWILMMSFLPKFINQNNPLHFNSFLLILVIMSIEFCSLSLYNFCGVIVSKFIHNNAFIIEKISAFIIFILAIWIIFE